MKGMVVYRISPIQDTLKNQPEYTSLPENFYQTEVFSSTEKGIELPLYWDDTRISQSGACTADVEGTYGNTIHYTTTKCIKKDRYGNCIKYGTTSQILVLVLKM